ncbi:MAG: sel1 repeat family protein, partial [Lachnospiraceae bacterium]|nr:sel1 repeat family protein [Lachnospiraceae bacterium]
HKRAEEEAARKAEEEAARKAEEERKRAEEEAARKAEEERIKAEEERKRAEEEAARKAEEERIKAEEERKRAEEEAARKAEEERIKAEEERKRAEEAARKAEEERIKAEEEAARKAEEERRKKEIEELCADAQSAGTKALNKAKKSVETARADLETALDKFHSYYQKAGKDVDNKEMKEMFCEIEENLGILYYQEKSYKLAAPLLKDASENGRNRAKVYMAEWCLRSRKELPEDPEELKKKLEEALADENLMKKYPEDQILANMILARIHLEGIGVKKNPAEAFKYYLKCAELGDVEAMAMVGNCYLYGEGIKKDTKTAFTWNEKAAKAGNERAIRNVAVSYDFGTGVKKDPKQAVEWYKKLLEILGNDRFAKYRIAICLSDPDREYGIKPTQEMYEEAVFYAKQAVEEGEKNANYILGYCYTFGKGVNKDHEQAYQYYAKAANQGHQKAKEKLNNFVKTNMGYVYK